MTVPPNASSADPTNGDGDLVDAGIGDGALGESTITGPAVRMTVSRVVQAVLYEHIQPHQQELPTQITVEFEPDFVAEVWKIRWPEAHGAIIGKMGGESPGIYSSLMGIHDSGYTPAADAVVDFDPIAAAFSLELILPEAALQAPEPNLAPEFAQEPEPDTVHMYEYSDGTLAITVPVEAGIDADDQFTPKPGARRVASLRATPRLNEIENAAAALPEADSLGAEETAGTSDISDAPRTTGGSTIVDVAALADNAVAPEVDAGASAEDPSDAAAIASIRIVEPRVLPVPTVQGMISPHAEPAYDEPHEPSLTEPAAELATEPATELATEPVADPTPEPSPEPIAEAVELITEAPEPVTEAPEPVTEAAEPIAEAPEPIAESSVAPVDESGAEPVDEPTAEPEAEPTVEQNPGPTFTLAAQKPAVEMSEAVTRLTFDLVINPGTNVDTAIPPEDDLTPITAEKETAPVPPAEDLPPVPPGEGLEAEAPVSSRVEAPGAPEDEPPLKPVPPAPESVRLNVRPADMGRHRSSAGGRHRL